MEYMGSKNKIAKFIIPIMLKNHKGSSNFYDLFCGGGNLIEKIPDTFKKFGNDKNNATILALKMIRNHLNEIPIHNRLFTKTAYLKCKRDYQKKPNMLNSYVGFAYSFGAKFYGGWRNSKDNRDYVSESQRSAEKQSILLQNVILSNLSYEEVKLEPKSLIYCDIPYRDTTAYTTGIFDYDAFYDWCRNKSKEGYTVFVSEYEAPEDFKCIWQKEVKCLMDKHGNNRRIEKLFLI